MDRIDILLATYNGAAFLGDQLDSIAAQTHRDWRLIARDDGSADRTPEILERFRTQHPDKTIVLMDSKDNLGLVQNFSLLMEHSEAPYVAFCDQDDVWVPEKLELSLGKMRELEREHSADLPLLVFTDLAVVNENLDVIDGSFWHYAKLRPERCNSMNRSLLQNVVTGCTALMNRPLVANAAPIPGDAIVHDWWVALVAAAFGFSGHVSQPTVLYRQHGQNLIGAREWTIGGLPAYIHSVLKDFENNRKAKLETFSQGAAFLETYADRLPTLVKDRIALILSLPRRGIISRFLASARYRCLPNGLWRKAGFIIIAHGEYK